MGSWYSNPGNKDVPDSGLKGVGKYLKSNSSTESVKANPAEGDGSFAVTGAKKQKRESGMNFQDLLLMVFGTEHSPNR
jgi:hypothetical protein